MTMRMSKDAYQNLIDENVSWLLRQERTLEREHILQVLRQSPAREYDDTDQMQSLRRINAQLLEALEDVMNSEHIDDARQYACAAIAQAKSKGVTEEEG